MEHNFKLSKLSHQHWQNNCETATAISKRPDCKVQVIEALMYNLMQLHYQVHILHAFTDVHAIFTYYARSCYYLNNIARMC